MSVKQPPITAPPGNDAKDTSPALALDSLPTQLESPPFGHDFVPTPPMECTPTRCREAPHDDSGFMSIDCLTDEPGPERTSAGLEGDECPASPLPEAPPTLLYSSPSKSEPDNSDTHDVGKHVDSDIARPARDPILNASISKEAEFVAIDDIANESTKPTNQQLAVSESAVETIGAFPPLNTTQKSSTTKLQVIRLQRATLQPSTSDLPTASSPKASQHFPTSAATKTRMTTRKPNMKSTDKEPSEPATKKPRARPRKHGPVEAPPIASPKRFKTKASGKPISPKRQPSTPKRLTKAAADEWQSIDEIQDSEPDVTPSPPTRRLSPSKHRSKSESTSDLVPTLEFIAPSEAATKATSAAAKNAAAEAHKFSDWNTTKLTLFPAITAT
ncbi:hypothetical protein LTS18_014899, partial [Coniosporium uncinatum]